MQEENSKLHFRIDEFNKGMVNMQSNNMFIATKLKQIVDKDKTLDVIYNEIYTIKNKISDDDLDNQGYKIYLLKNVESVPNEPIVKSNQEKKTINTNDEFNKEKVKD